MSPISDERREGSKGIELFGQKLSRSPARTLLGLALEYAGFLAAVVFVVLLLVTRVPLRLVDRALGTRTRERLIELLARVSPG